MEVQKYRLRTRLKHLYFRIKKNALNFTLSFKTYYKFQNLKNSNSLHYKNLEEFYNVNNINIIEGNSTQSKLQSEFLIKFDKNFKNILEIGFNAGHSSEIFLSTNPKSIVTSIDIGYWYYGKFGVEFLNKKFPNRLNVIFKDSLLALKDFSTFPEGTIFDFIYIDGNHSYEYALNDIINCQKFSNKDTLVLVDDVVIDDKYRTLANTGPTKAWNKLLKEEYILEVDIAHFKDINRGVAVAKYNL